MADILSSKINFLLIGFEVISDLKKFWQDLEALTTKPELQEVKKEYFQAYTMTCWNYIWKSLLYYILLATLFVFAGHSDDSAHYVIFPLACLGYVAVNIFIQKTQKSCIGLMVYFSFFSVITTNMSVSKPRYEYYEGWSVMNTLFIIIAIAFCLEWRRIIKVFFLCRLYYLANVYYTYGSMPFVSWFFFIFEIICVCIITIALSKIVLSFIEINIKINHLLKTIRKLLEVFPESVVIESFDSELKQSIVRFINDTAKKEFFNKNSNEDFNDSHNLDLNLKVNEDSENYLKDSCNISEFLQNQINSANEVSQEVSSKIKVTKTGSEERYFSVKTIMVEWEEDKQACMHVFTDMTHVKKLEHEKAINKCLHLMFSSVSHELRTPLNAFKHAIGFMKNYYDEYKKLKIRNVQTGELKKTDELFNKFHKIASISSSTLLNLIEDILDMAKIESGTFSLNVAPFKLQDLIDDIEFIFGFQCAQKKLKFKINYEECSPEVIAVSDICRIKQVLMNLISNSFKFTQRGSILVTISEFREHDIRAFKSHSYLQFKVEDTGIGITKDNQENLFKIFGKLSQSNKKINVEGTGLGLNICK